MKKRVGGKKNASEVEVWEKGERIPGEEKEGRNGGRRARIHRARLSEVGIEGTPQGETKTKGDIAEK